MTEYMQLVTEIFSDSKILTALITIFLLYFFPAKSHNIMQRCQKYLFQSFGSFMI